MGIQYVCDWGNDDQPYPMTTPAGELYALPILSELDDVAMSFNRRVAINEWSDLVKLSFDVQYLEGAKNGRLVVVSVHPWCLGQPHRIKYLDQALGHMLSNARGMEGHRLRDCRLVQQASAVHVRRCPAHVLKLIPFQQTYSPLRFDLGLHVKRSPWKLLLA